MKLKRRVVVELESPEFSPIVIDEDYCTGCNFCLDVCQVDVFLPASEVGDPPTVAYPGECWQCGDCVDVCPAPGAIDMNPMPKNRVHWKRKETGEGFHL